MVYLDSGLCVLKGIIELKKQGVFAALLIEITLLAKACCMRHDKAHFDDIEVGKTDALSGTMEKVPFHI
jgi:hypothetical protein